MPKKNYAELARDTYNKMQTLLDTAKKEDRSLSDEEAQVFDGLENTYKEYKKQAEFEKKVADIQKDLDASPGTLPVDIVADSDVKVGKDRIVDKKWENKGEFFLAVMNAGGPNPILDPRLIETSGIKNATGMSISVQGDGGFMVGAENEAWLMESVKEQSLIFPRITMFPVGENRNSISIPAVAETSRADGYRFGGVRAYWAAEAATVTASKPTLRDVDLKLEKLMALCYTTEELLQDARLLEAFVKKTYGAEMSYQLDDAILNADGNGKPLGILNGAGIISTAKETGQSADTVVYENIIKMWSKLGARYRANAVWLINQEVEPELFSMSMTVGTGGVPVYMPANGISGQQFGTLFGRPVIPVEQCQKLGDKGDIILCDLSDYIGIDKNGLAIDSSIHVQFLYDENIFRFRYRFNGTPYTNSALTSAKNSSFTSGPYVTLAERA